MLDGQRIQLANPTVSDSVIVGLPFNEMNRVVMYDTLRVATDSVARIEIRENDGKKTLMAVTSVIVVVGLIAFVAMYSSWCNHWEC